MLNLTSFATCLDPNPYSDNDYRSRKLLNTDPDPQHCPPNGLEPHMAYIIEGVQNRPRFLGLEARRQGDKDKKY